MRRAGITYIGAFHPAKLHIPIFAYCTMNSHCHLVLENSSGKMSELLKQVEGQFGMYYRKHSGVKGYVFQNRF